MIETPEYLISNFLAQSTGLKLKSINENEIVILQSIDNKTLRIATSSIEDVLSRTDADGRPFLQINFCDGRKILLTEKLVGFKPIETQGLDLKKLPRVVTTPDLVSVVEALEESLAVSDPRHEEVEVLRKVFESVLAGAEAIGFEIDSEKNWINCLPSFRRRPSA